MPKNNKDLRGYFGRARGANAAPAAVPPPAAPADAAAPRSAAAAAGPRTAGSIAARVFAAPDAVPSAAAAGRQSRKEMKVEDKEDPADPMEVEDGAGVNRKLSACLKNEVDKRWDETEADGEERWSPGGKHDRGEKPRAKRRRRESDVDSKKATRTVRVVSADKHLRNELGRGRLGPPPRYQHRAHRRTLPRRRRSPGPFVFPGDDLVRSRPLHRPAHPVCLDQEGRGELHGLRRQSEHRAVAGRMGTDARHRGTNLPHHRPRRGSAWFDTVSVLRGRSS
ncbi:hypothetical protein THAOC_17566 [Thalassiosira oceanica]|uniref:Uncharacterized protein n=1 Tax=Thalassiosira oceanica TaxID=159749 RepID=K0S996_THAOC|nr:hypothetical protein THAOC_17566 [Thalassiosira oceanica]|eukprot:EJK61865.1 hypothetical protein THAOC_17566 [Thalassiosira oceanica]